MSIELWTEIQEALFYTTGPVLFWWLVFVLIGALLSAIGVVISENFPQINPLD